MIQQGFWFVNVKGDVNVKGELLTYEQFLARREEALWMTMGMVRNYGREDAPAWNKEERCEEGHG